MKKAVLKGMCKLTYVVVVFCVLTVNVFGETARNEARIGAMQKAHAALEEGASAREIIDSSYNVFTEFETMLQEFKYLTPDAYVVTYDNIKRKPSEFDDNHRKRFFQLVAMLEEHFPKLEQEISAQDDYWVRIIQQNIEVVSDAYKKAEEYAASGYLDTAQKIYFVFIGYKESEQRYQQLTVAQQKEQTTTDQQHEQPVVKQQESQTKQTEANSSETIPQTTQDKAPVGDEAELQQAYNALQEGITGNELFSLRFFTYRYPKSVISKSLKIYQVLEMKIVYYLRN